MANEEQLKLLKQGVEVWNEWRNENIGDEIDLSGALLHRATLIGANLSDSNLRRIDLSGVDLYGANLHGADLSDADLRKANLLRANLGNTNLRRASINGAELHMADLNEANLCTADLSDASLRRSNLSGADISNAYVSDTNLSDSNLSKANLCKTVLRGSNLSRANLNDANLNSSDLGGVYFHHSLLIGTSLSRSSLNETSFINVNLSQVKGLRSVKFRGPCPIDNRTLQQSDNLPNFFLEGCGLSDWEIESAKLFNPKLSSTEIVDIVYKIDQLRSSDPIQIHNLFISYSHENSDFVDFLEPYLQKQKVRFWRDIHDAPAGPLESIVVRAMNQNPTVLLIFSDSSIDSDWVEFEIDNARKLEKEHGRNVLCPIALDDSWKSCNWSGILMNQVKKYNILDFSQWRDETKFQGMFRRLLSGLNLFYKEA